MRILLVEDTIDVGEALVARLDRLGHTVDWETCGLAADDALAADAFDLVILDINLPSMDGFALLRRLRDRRSRALVLVLTARSQVDDRVHALDLGADDYLVKPFEFRELEARVRALLRRGQGGSTDQIAFGEFVFDRRLRQAAVGGVTLDLTRRELTLLEILLSRSGRIFSKDELVEQLFGYRDEPSANAIEQSVTRLRRKLVGSGVEIRALRGLGYQILCR